MHDAIRRARCARPLIYGAGDVRVEDVPTRPCRRRPMRWCGWCGRASAGATCGPTGRCRRATGTRIGHEFLGVVEDVGSEVSTLKAGDLVVAPFVYSDNTCTSAPRGSTPRAGTGGCGAVTASTAARARWCGRRRRMARWSSCRWARTALLPSLLTLSDVFPTGHHCAADRRRRAPHHGDGDRGRRASASAPSWRPGGGALAASS